MMIYSLNQAMIVVPYFFVSLFLSMLLFLPVLIYVWNRMRYVGRLKEEILVMSEGDLEHPITVKGRDEIGILAGNLNEMRLTLDENI
ncbi:MAG: HAMP domain-containing protein, partial [Eubacterium sp.]|nr:HAMP domain-containing protein [Eubacterium sp.]